jgi:DNA-binding CsgD family transcriptional regulator
MSNRPDSPAAASAALSALGDQEALWRMLTREPSTGVGIITIDGQIVYVNDQAVRIFHGPDALAKDYIGRRWDDHMPDEWTQERLATLRNIKRTGVPVLMRTIWRGFQHLTWIYPAARESEGPENFLTLTRRAADDAEAEQLAPRGQYTWVDSKVANLGPLDVLSDRELEVLALLGQGLTIDDTAKVLFRSPETIKSHRRAIGEKLGVSERVLLAKIASRAGLRLEDVELDRVSSGTSNP